MKMESTQLLYKYQTFISPTHLNTKLSVCKTLIYKCGLKVTVLKDFYFSNNTFAFSYFPNSFLLVIKLKGEIHSQRGKGNTFCNSRESAPFTSSYSTEMSKHFTKEGKERDGTAEFNKQIRPLLLASSIMGLSFVSQAPTSVIKFLFIMGL